MIEILNYREVNKGSVKGTFSVKLHKWGGFIIRDLMWFQSGENDWIAFPSKTIEKDGVKSYIPLVGFDNKNFNDALKERIRQEVKAEQGI